MEREKSVSVSSGRKKKELGSGRDNRVQEAKDKGMIQWRLPRKRYILSWF